MDIESLKVVLAAFGAIAAVATPLLGIPLARKTLAEVRHLERGRRRTESDFAFKLADSTGDPVIKRYAEELGFAALTGDRHLTHDERKRLVSLPDSERDIETYMRTRKLITIIDDERHFIWKRPRYDRAKFRSLIRLGWAIVYLVSCALAMAPWLIWGVVLRTPWSGALSALQAYMFVLFVPVAFISLHAGSRLNEAERFIKDVQARKARALKAAARQVTALQAVLQGTSPSGVSLGPATGQHETKPAAPPTPQATAQA